jgi:hypothetical protein
MLGAALDLRDHRRQRDVHHPFEPDRPVDGGECRAGDGLAQLVLVALLECRCDLSVDFVNALID